MRWLNIVLFMLGGLVLQAQARQPGGPRPKGSDVFDDLPGSDAASASALRSHEDGARKIRVNIFVRATFDRPACYVGDQVMLTCKLYTALQSNSSIIVKPSLNGFISREWPEDDGDPKETTKEEKAYRVFTIWQVVLTPLQPGDFTLDPLSVNNDVSYPMADGGTGHYSGGVMSNRAAIRVLPGPEAGKPPGYSGLVGHWSMHSRLTAGRMAPGDADTLWFEMDGTGSFGNLPMPDIRWPSGLLPLRAVERLDVKEKSFPEVGKKVIGVPFTANATGKYVLPAVGLAYLEPGGSYHVVRSDSLALVVDSGGMIGAAGQGSAGPRGAGRESADGRGRWWLYYGLAALLLVVVGAGLWWRRRRISKPPVMVPVEQPEPDLAARLAAIDTISDDNGYLTGIKELLICYMQLRLRSDAWAEEELLQKLRERDGRVAAAVGPTLDLCNELLYAPHLWGAAMRADLRARMTDLLGGRI